MTNESCIHARPPFRLPAGPVAWPTATLCAVFLLTALTGTALAVDGNTLDLTLRLPAPPAITTSRDGHLRVDFPGAVPEHRTGAPDLPAWDVEVVLPPGYRAGTVVVVPEGVDTQTGLPAPATVAPLLDDTGTPMVVPPDTTGWGRLLGTTWRHGVGIAHVRLRPARWDETAGGRLRLASAFRARITLATDDTDHPRPRRWHGDLAADVLASGRVVNPSDLVAYRTPTPVRSDAPVFAPTAVPSLEGSPVEMVIVTTDELAGIFAELAEEKTARGLPTVVRTIEWIDEHYPRAEDEAATIRAFLTDAYEQWGTRFVLLGGDVDLVPTRMLFSSFYPTGEGSEIPADCFYAGLDGDWNADRDAVPGEPYISAWDTGDAADLDAELLVGRAPARTATDAQVFVDKVRAYELEDVGDYQGHLMFMSEVLFPSNYAPGDTIVEDGAAHSEDIVQYVLPPEVQSDRYYETWELWSGAQPETRSAVLAAMDTGQYGLVNHIGHGFFYDMSVGDATIRLPDASALSNAHPFILNNLNCASAAIDMNCILERFVTNPHGGAVASIGLSRAAFPSTASQYQREFFEAIYVDGVPTLGEAVEESKRPFIGSTLANTVERWTHLTMVLIGDPTLLVTPRVPVAMTVEAPQSVSAGTTNLAVIVTDAAGPVAGATVCVVQDSMAWATAVTDADGTAVLSLDLPVTRPVHLTVTAPGRIPVQRDLPVVAGGPVLAVALTGIDDAGPGTVGDGDGNVESGETVALHLSVTNTGDADLSGPLSLTVSSPDDGVLVTTPDLVVTSLPVGATIDPAPTGVLVSLDPSLPDQSDLHLEVTGSDGSLIVHQELVVPVTAPRIAVEAMTWNDFPYGDGDGVPEAGEIIVVSFTLRNEGWADSGALTGELQPSPGVTIVAGEASWPEVPALGTAAMEGEFRVVFTVMHDAFKADLAISDALGHVWHHAFTILPPDRVTIGTATTPGPGEAELTWVPLQDESLLGYFVDRSLQPNGPWERLTLTPVRGAFYHDTGLAPMTRYFYSIVPVDSSGVTGRRSSVYYLDTLPGEVAGFPVPLGAETSSHCAVGDVDGDGALEVVVPADAIYVWRADGSELKDGDGDPTTTGVLVGSGRNWSPSGVTLADVTDDPGLEIVANCVSDATVNVFLHDGSQAPGWPQTMSAWGWAAPTVGDIDGDGSPEIIVTDIRGITYAWHADGSEVRDGDADPGTHGVFHVRENEWYSFASPALADLDGDRLPEVIIPSRIAAWTNQYLYALRADGTAPTGWPVDLGNAGKVNCSPACGDLDGDGRPEVVVITEDDYLYVIDGDGREVPPFPVNFPANSQQAGISCPSPALADVDGDGTLDIVAVAVISAMESELHVIGLNGVDLAGWPQALEGNSEASPVVGDADGDGRQDIFFPVGGGDDAVPNLIYGFEGDGSVFKGFPLVLEGPGRSTPTLTDLDGDGDVDLVYAGWGLQAHAWDLPGLLEPDMLAWPTFQHDAARSGNLAGAPGSTVDVPSTLPDRPVLLGSSPNPFNPRTVIRYALPVGFRGRVELTVYDLAGRRIRRLVDDVQSGGIHAVSWQGRDDAGRPVASGVYLYRLTAGGVAASGRLLLAR